MIEIIPAIIPKTFEGLEEKMSNVAGLAPLVQVDVLDGSLVPARSWPYQSPTKRDAFFDAIIKEQQGFPSWQDVEFEAHFMIREPERKIDDWIAAGATRIIIQIEGTSDFRTCLNTVAERVPVGISLALDTPTDVVKPFAVDAEVIQLMGWNFSHLGRQGEPFDEHTYAKIEQLRQDFPKHIISIDGGVTLENAPALLRAGADRLVVGSAIFGAGNPREALQGFNRLKKSL